MSTLKNECHSVRKILEHELTNAVSLDDYPTEKRIELVLRTLECVCTPYEAHNEVVKLPQSHQASTQSVQQINADTDQDERKSEKRTEIYYLFRSPEEHNYPTVICYDPVKPNAIDQFSDLRASLKAKKVVESEKQRYVQTKMITIGKLLEFKLPNTSSKKVYVKQQLSMSKESKLLLKEQAKDIEQIYNWKNDLKNEPPFEIPESHRKSLAMSISKVERRSSLLIEQDRRASMNGQGILIGSTTTNPPIQMPMKAMMMNFDEHSHSMMIDQRATNTTTQPRRSTTYTTVARKPDTVQSNISTNTLSSDESSKLKSSRSQSLMGVVQRVGLMNVEDKDQLMECYQRAVDLVAGRIYTLGSPMNDELSLLAETKSRFTNGVYQYFNEIPLSRLGNGPIVPPRVVLIGDSWKVQQPCMTPVDLSTEWRQLKKKTEDRLRDVQDMRSTNMIFEILDELCRQLACLGELDLAVCLMVYRLEIWKVIDDARSMASSLISRRNRKRDLLNKLLEDNARGQLLADAKSTASLTSLGPTSVGDQTSIVDTSSGFSAVVDDLVQVESQNSQIDKHVQLLQKFLMETLSRYKIGQTPDVQLQEHFRSTAYGGQQVEDMVDYQDRIAQVSHLMSKQCSQETSSPLMHEMPFPIDEEGRQLDTDDAPRDRAPTVSRMSTEYRQTIGRRVSGLKRRGSTEIPLRRTTALPNNIESSDQVLEKYKLYVGPINAGDKDEIREEWIERIVIPKLSMADD